MELSPRPKLAANKKAWLGGEKFMNGGVQQSIPNLLPGEPDLIGGNDVIIGESDYSN